VLSVVILMLVGQVNEADGGLEAPEADAGVIELAHDVDAGTVELTVESSVDGGAPDGGPQRETRVTAERTVDVRRVAGSAQIVGREELERLETNDINRVLQGVPGAYVREEEGFGNRPNIGFRGASSDRSSKVALMEDGVLIAPAPYSAPSAYFFPSMTRMVAVEVFKGPAAIRYGPNTIGGALNLRTRDIPTSGLEGDLDLALGNYGYGKGHGVLAWGDEQFGVLLEGVRWGSTGFKLLDGGGDTGFTRNEFMLKARASTTPSNVFRTGFEIKLAYGDEASRETYTGLSDADFRESPYRRYAATARDLLSISRTQLQLTNVTTIGTQLEVRTTGYRFELQRRWNRFNGFRKGPSAFNAIVLDQPADEPFRAVLRGGDSQNLDQSVILQDANRPHVSQGVQTTARWRVGDDALSNELEAGLRFHHDEARRLDDNVGYQMMSGVLVPDSMGRSVNARRVDYTRAFSAWLQDSFAWKRLLVAPGARVELIDTFSSNELRGTLVTDRNVVPLFGLGAVYSFDFGLSLLAGVHQGFSPVAPGQSPDVRPERAINSEFGARYAQNGTRAELIGFWSEYENITGTCTNSTGCAGDEVLEQFNGGKARVLGFEALASRRQRLPMLGLSLTGELSYTFTRARFLTSFNSENPLWGAVAVNDALPYVPEHQFSLRVRLNKGPFEASVGAAYFGEMREEAGQSADDLKLPSRWMVDATASIEFGQARFYATATNLLNQAAPVSRRPFGMRPQAPMIAQVGFKYAFR
jgi:Fe(3+) dicitrate transport protein